MRLELSGSLTAQDPIVIVCSTNRTFIPLDYVALGYTNFDVLCIGGGGGSGGGLDTNNTGTLIRSYGGAGGGGGIHRVRGVLSGLPSSLDIVVGAGGAMGDSHSSDASQTTDGADGGASSFHVDVCLASGGMGGNRVENNSFTVSSVADGGDGGIGGQSTAGGGGAGGIAGVPTSGGPGTAGDAGVDGVWDGTIGSGGGGGAGGVAKYSNVACNLATAGGKGAYNTNDPSAYAVGGIPTTDPQTGALSTVPGFAGGAKAALVSNLPTIYGSSKPADSGNPGVVIIRLTAE